MGWEFEHYFGLNHILKKTCLHETYVGCCFLDVDFCLMTVLWRAIGCKERSNGVDQQNSCTQAQLVIGTSTMTVIIPVRNTKSPVKPGSQMWFAVFFEVSYNLLPILSCHIFLFFGAVFIEYISLNVHGKCISLLFQHVPSVSFPSNPLNPLLARGWPCFFQGLVDD